MRYAIISTIIYFFLLTTSTAAPFITRWDTSKPGNSSNTSILFTGVGTNYTIDWHEVSNPSNSGSITGTNNTQVNFPSAGIYELSVEGGSTPFHRIIMMSNGDKERLISIEAWGTINWSSMENAFRDCINLQINAADSPILGAISLKRMFQGASSLNSFIGNWSVKNVVNVEYMFKNAINFNQPLNSWDVGDVVTFEGMFQDATSFNQDLDDWNACGATNYSYIFDGASAFNGEVNDWCVSNAVEFERTFRGASSFNQPLDQWNMGNVENIFGMFSGASSFNQDLQTWNTSEVTNMSWVFRDASSFNGNIDSWLTSKVETMLSMFQGATVFNRDITNWNTSSVTHFKNTFLNASAFDQDISSWNIGSITNLEGMLDNSGISAATYDLILDGWEQQTVNTGLIFGVAGMSYCDGTSERQLLIENSNWQFQGDSFGCPQNSFMTTWQTDNAGASSNTEIIFPGRGIHYVIMWEEENNPSNSGALLATDETTVSFPSAGTYTLSVLDGDPAFHRFWMHPSDDPLKLLSVDQWGTIGWSSLTQAFVDCKNMDILATDTPDLSLVADLDYTFFNNFVMDGSMSTWDVSSIESFEGTFFGASLFNQDISSWDVSDASNMKQMFLNADAFDQDISGWNVGNVTNMKEMFQSTELFNLNIGGWDITSVTDMEGMFDFTPLTDSIYNAILVGWANQDVQQNVILGAKNVAYCKALTGRAMLIANHGWDIQEDIETCSGHKFITTWDTEVDDNSAPNQIIFPGHGENYVIEYSLVSTPQVNGIFSAINKDTLTLPSPGVYELKVSGGTVPFHRIRHSVSDDSDKLLAVNQWGSTQWSSMEHAFFLCKNFNISASDTPDLSVVTNMNFMFASADNFNSDINSWDVSNVVEMNSVFQFAINYNQPLNAWHVGNVVHMRDVFRSASSFNQPLNLWNTEQVEDMTNLFRDASAFNQDISSWNTANVTSMDRLFFGASAFNQPLNSWNVGSVTSMHSMFSAATVFNQPLNLWNTENVEIMTFLFYNASAFNQNISSWNTSKVTSMSSLFRNASTFNQVLNTWDVSAVTNMSFMFQNATSFNQPLNQWVTNSLERVDNMFKNASSFNKDISSWNFSEVERATGMLDNSSLSQNNYELLLESLAFQNLKYNVTMGVVGMEYCNTLYEHHRIEKQFNWNLFGDTDICESDRFITTWNTTLGGNPLKINFGATGIAYKIFFVKINNPNIFGVLQGDNAQTINLFQSGTYRLVVYGGTNPISSFSFQTNPLQLIAINQWGTTQWTTMEEAFLYCKNFQILAADNPDLSQVESMHGMFYLASNFNDDISDWDVSSVTDMSAAFGQASTYNQPLNTWDVSNATKMNGMFSGASSFNQPIDSWDTGSVESLAAQFEYASAFNQPINSWDVSKVISMRWMFRDAIMFNQPLNSWNLDSIIHQHSMFEGATAFNQPLDDWNIGASNLSEMFRNATSFNQDISMWDFSQVSSALHMLDSTALSQENYDKLLESLATQNLQNNVDFGAASLEYCNSLYEREHLEKAFSWNIVGDMDACKADRFITTWDTSLGGNPHSISLGVDGTNYNIYWKNVNDSTSYGRELGVDNHQVSLPAEGTYELIIYGGEEPMDRFYGALDPYKLIAVNQWGTTTWSTLFTIFKNCENLTMIDTLAPDLSDAFSMTGAFLGAKAFDQNINHWNVSEIKAMSGTFENASSFNQPLDQWNVQDVVSMRDMFSGASNFDQDLGSWNVERVSNMSGMFDSCFLSIDNYDNTLIGWASQSVKDDVVLDAPVSYYCLAEDERNSLMTDHGWTINDKGSAGVVNTHLDSIDGSLRWVLDQGCKGTIYLDVPTDSILIVENSPIVVPFDLNIIGDTINMHTISGQNQYQIFDIGVGIELGLENLKVMNGYAPVDGGALKNSGTLYLNNVIFEGNMEGLSPKSLTNTGDIFIEPGGDVIFKE